MSDFIYVLKCPETKKIRYIGKSHNPSHRLRAHISRAVTLSEQHHSANWIRSLIRKGLRPELEIVALIPDGEDWRDVERAFIAKAKTDGIDITNATAGGDGGDLTPDALRRMSDASKRDWLKPGQRDRRVKALSATITKKWQDIEYREKCTASSNEAWSRKKKDPSYAEGRQVNRIRAFILFSESTIFYNRDLRIFCAHHSILSGHLANLIADGLIAEVSVGIYAKLDGSGALASPLKAVAENILSDCGINVSAYDISIVDMHNGARLRLGKNGAKVSIERPIYFKGQYAVATRRSLVRTHCIHGHEFNDKTTYVTPTGYWQCVTCKKDRKVAMRVSA